MSKYKPPFHLTEKMITLVAEISELVGRITLMESGSVKAHLRRENRIKPDRKTITTHSNNPIGNLIVLFSLN